MPADGLKIPQTFLARVVRRCGTNCAAIRQVNAAAIIVCDAQDDV
jgi:hypothetical protein